MQSVRRARMRDNGTPADEQPAEAPLDVRLARIVIRTTIVYRSRSYVVEAEGLTLEQLADLLDKRLGPAQQG